MATGKVLIQPKHRLDVVVSQAALVAGAAAGAAAIPATKTVAGIVKMAALVPGAAGANPTQAEFAALLAALKAAGLMSTT